MNLNSILIGSENPEALVAYYAKLFGDGDSDGSYTGWKLGNGYLAIGPHSDVKGKNPAPGRILWNLESDDVAGDFDRLKAAGAVVVQEPYKPGTDDDPPMQIATFEDPDGNYFQIMSPMPEMS